MKNCIRTFFAFVCILFFSGMLPAQKNQSIGLLKKFSIASSGGWDYLAISPVHDWLYVSHATQVNILNKTTGDSVGVILNTTGVHGIAFDPANKKGFTSNGRLNNVTVFDINTNEILAQIPTGINPDAIFLEPFSKKIITCNGRSKTLSIIDPATNQLVDSIFVGGKPETAVSDGAGNLWVNVEDKHEIVRINLRTLQVTHHYSLAPAESPTGLAYDPQSKRLFAGCDKTLVVVDALEGNIIAQLPIGEGCDGVAFDPALRMIYTSNGAAGTLSIIQQIDANKYQLVDNLPSQKSAKTITLDPVTHWVYLPAAELEPLAPGETGRPKVKPGTFQILVFGSNEPVKKTK
ncbi:MAG: YncE family protein [Chitinophagia bacterium]